MVAFHILYINHHTPTTCEGLWEPCSLPANLHQWAMTNQISNRDLLLGKLTRRLSEFLPMDDTLQAVARINSLLPEGDITGTLMVIRHNKDNNTRI